MSRKSTGHTERGLLSAHNTQNGKGDADRSPKWRDHYHEIDWQPERDSGFQRVGSGRHFRKTYGDAKEKHPAPYEASREYVDEINAVYAEANRPAPFVQIAPPLLSK